MSAQLQLSRDPARDWRPYERVGRLVEVRGLRLEAAGLSVRLKELCTVARDDRPLLAEVVGFNGGRAVLAPLDAMDGVEPAAVVRATGRPLTVRMGPGLLGRVLDGLGRPVDGRGPLPPGEGVACNAVVPGPMDRPRICRPLATGVRSIDAFTTLGEGQRIGIFAGAGVGKSTLLGMIARRSQADVNVIALCGERGREVKEFLERDLGEGLARSVVLVATSDQPAMQRVRVAELAHRIADRFREGGRRVLLLMDSLTRFAFAQRELGLAAGEPPATRGYPPSVFAALPRLVEQAGTGPGGSVTAIYTVLVEGDDLEEPVADSVRSLLDGHIVLSRRLAERGLFPAVDVLRSLSRVMPEVVDADHRRAAARVRAWMSVYEAAEDLIQVGAYRAGQDPELDTAVAMRPRWLAFLAQDRETAAPPDEVRRALLELGGEEA